MNLTELTNYVWTQTDTTEYDLAAATIASYIDEAFTRTIAAENRWPSYEKTWTVIVPIGAQGVAALDSDVNRSAIMSVYRMADGIRLTEISEEEGELQFGVAVYEGVGLNPSCYSFWENEIRFWPAGTSDEEVLFGMRGYRKPLTTFAVSGEVDADPRLHKALAHYAAALAYAAQEDEVLEDKYMQRWMQDVELARSAIMEPSHHRPAVMHGNFPRTPIGGRRDGGWW